MIQMLTFDNVLIQIAARNVEVSHFEIYHEQESQHEPQIFILIILVK